MVLTWPPPSWLILPKSFVPGNPWRTLSPGESVWSPVPQSKFYNIPYYVHHGSWWTCHSSFLNNPSLIISPISYVSISNFFIKASFYKENRLFKNFIHGYGCCVVLTLQKLLVVNFLELPKSIFCRFRYNAGKIALVESWPSKYEGTTFVSSNWMEMGLKRNLVNPTICYYCSSRWWFGRSISLVCGFPTLL